MTILSLGCSGLTRTIVWSIIIVIIVIPLSIRTTTTHADITSNADTATLLGDDSAELSALRETRELFGGEDGEGSRLDLQTMRHMSGAMLLRVFSSLGVHITTFLQLFVQRKAQPVLALMADRKIGKDEVASRFGSVEVGHASDGSSSQHGEGRLRLRRDATLSEMAGIFQSSKEEEVGLVGEGDVGLGIRSFEDAKLNDRRRVDWTAVGRGLCT
jgi:hypothetical protein